MKGQVDPQGRIDEMVFFGGADSGKYRNVWPPAIEDLVKKVADDRVDLGGGLRGGSRQTHAPVPPTLPTGLVDEEGKCQVTGGNLPSTDKSSVGHRLPDGSSAKNDHEG
jgi:hypothetical protein